MKRYRHYASHVRSYLGFCVLFAPSLLVTSRLQAQELQVRLPNVYANDTTGNALRMPSHELFDFELRLREQFARLKAPDEVIAFAGAHKRDLIPELRSSVSLVMISVFGEQGKLRWYVGDTMERYYHRTVFEAELAEIREFISVNKIDDLPKYNNIREIPGGKTIVIVGGAQYIYVRMNAQRGTRIVFDDPSSDYPEFVLGDPSPQYAKLLEFFGKLKDPQKLQVRYAFPRPIKGLEVLFARPDTEIVSVWQQNDDLCVIARNAWKFDAPTRNVILRNGTFGEEVASSPRSVVYTMSVNGVELKTPIKSADGRWVVGNLEESGDLTCYDLQKLKFVNIPDDKTRTGCHPLHYLAAHNVFLLAQLDASRVPKRSGFPWYEPYELRVLNPATGEASDLDTLPGVASLQLHSRPLWFQTLPHQLQAVTGAEHVVWASVPLANVTKVGQFDTATFQWQRSARIPNLTFETKDMWVDEVAQKLYVAYKGHLLRLPLPEALAETRKVAP